MFEAVKVALDPTPAQERLMLSHAGAARFAYNAGLAHVKAALEVGEKLDWSYFSLVNWWNANKDTLAVDADGVPWWRENSKEAASSGLRALASALSNWSKSRKGKRKGPRVGFPKFKSKDRETPRFSYSTSGPGTGGLIEGDPKALWLPRIGRVHCMENVTALVNGAKVLRMAVSQRAGRWYAALTVERDEPTTTKRVPKGGAVGIDLGVKRLATLSDGTVIPNPHALAADEQRLRRAQKALSRKKIGSKRRAKARERVARIHARVANRRNDTLHKLTTRLAQTYSDISIEDLNVAGMVKNHHLAKAISDASFFELRRMLEYKTAKTGAKLHFVDRWYPSSKTCSNCGSVKAKLSLSERTYTCGNCGLVIDRDLNAAINIKVAGSAPETLNACGGDVRRADIVSGNADPGETRTKQSPTGGVRLGAGLGNEAMRTRTN